MGSAGFRKGPGLEAASDALSGGQMGGAGRGEDDYFPLNWKHCLWILGDINYKAKNNINSNLLVQCGIVPRVLDSSLILLYASWLAPEPGLQSITLKFTVFCCHEMCYRRRCRIIFWTLPVSDNSHSDSDLTPELFPSQGFSCDFKRFGFYLNKYWKKPWCNLIITFPVRYL